MKISRRSVHLVAGITLLTYVLSHLLNHAFGVVSLDAMERARTYFISPWTTTPGILLLATAALLHLGSALWVLYIRRNLRLPPWQWTQLILGLAIPLLVADHAAATGYARLMYGLQPNYAYVLANLWYFDPTKGWLQMTLLCVAWGHACVGLRNWLKVKAWYPRWAVHLYALAILVPALAIMGFVSAGYRVLALIEDPAWIFDVLQNIKYPSDDAVRSIFAARDGWMIAYTAAVVAVLVARQLRLFVQRQGDNVYLTYKAGGKRIQVLPGATVLETLRSVGIPHASICGGRARCSTCRVKLVKSAADACAAPGPEEERVLKRLMLPSDVRLACQVRPTRDVICEPLLPPDVTMAEALQPGKFTAGHEVEMTILFADLRGFTTLSESKLPFDVVYLLNQYFETMGAVIEAAGGTIDKFIGDGIMATFGSGSDADAGATAALHAARGMGQQLEAMNARLKNDLKEPLRLGVGLHAGPAIRGTMGYGEASQVTVIGDTVNTASRLESATKEHGAQCMFSEIVREKAGLDASAYKTTVIQVRGRTEPLVVYMVERVAGIDEMDA